MTAKHCTFIPSKGASLFRTLKKQFGYEFARKMFLRAINPKFISDFKDTLSLDAEGVPTYETLMANSYMKALIGKPRMLNALNNAYSPKEDTRDNYSILLQQAYQFNTTHPSRDDFVATVEYASEDKIIIKIQDKTDTSLERFKDQYATQQVNESLASIFQPLGVNIGHLTDAEVKAGRVGVTDFSIARGIANGFVSVIKVANNMEGATALTEEFSHLIVGVFRNEPFLQRAISLLENNEEALKTILGDDYEDVVNYHDGNMEMVAEEALGHVLRDSLLSQDKPKNTPSPSLFRRMMNWIVQKFKGYNPNEVQDVIDRVDTIMSDLMHDIVAGTRKITQEDIISAQREASFNALSDRIDRNISILKNAAKVETKRYKISKDSSGRMEAELLVDDLLEHADAEADTVEGIFKYAEQALKELRNLEIQFQMADAMTPKQKFAFLRRVRMYTQSYGAFINSVNDALIEDESESDNLFIRDFENEEGEMTNVREVISELNNLSKNLARRFNKMAVPAFAEFLKPFLGEEIVVPFGKHAGQKISVEELLKEAPGDISFMDRWLDSMADSADTLLQLFDSAVRKANSIARENTIDGIREIQMFREWAENLGITDFSWMFEVDSDGHKSGNYLSEVNYAQFDKELKEMEQELEEKYGKNPSGPNALKKIEERKAWLEKNSMSVFGNPMPNPTVYRNEAYFNLTANQRKVLDRFLAIKDKYDAKLPKTRVSRNKAIQIRKSGGQRLIESVSSPSTLYGNLKEMVASSLFEREDDDQMFGTSKATKGLTDFNGNEFMTLPVLYTSRLKNPDELSDDVIGSLMAYAYMANQYEQMDEIVDALEIGRVVATDPDVRTVNKTRGGNLILEKFEALDIEVVNKVRTKKTNIEDKLNDFFESQVYHRYLKDEGTWNILGKQVNVNKLTSMVLKASSLAQLGLNFLANTANVMTGAGMQNIEAVAGQFFNVQELAKADWAYKSELIPFMAELSSRTKTNKLALFYELFDIKQDFGTRVKHNQKKSWLRKIFGADIAFIGQDAGDHWLYGRTAIAMAYRKQVLLDGKKMSLWEALQVEGIEGSDKVKQLNYKKITELDGSPLDVHDFTRRVAKVNQRCFGIYNDEDSNAANRVAMGRLLQQYRKWMKVQYNARFQANQRDVTLGVWSEGYYRTVGRILNQWIRGGVQLSAQWQNMTDDEKYNVRRAITEMVQFFAVWALANWFEWPDDKERPWALKMAEYSSKRLAHELGGLAPTFVMPQELLKTVKSPVPSATVLQNSLNLAMSAVDPTDWVDEIQSGPYKGMSTFEKNFIKAPLPGVAQFRQIDKFIGDLDTSIGYYMRPAY